VTVIGWGLGYPRSVDLQADGRMAAEVDSTLVVAGVLRIPGPLPADDRQEQTSHRNHRCAQRLVAVLTAGLLLAACSSDGRSTASSPVAPDSTATTMATTGRAATKVPTTTPPRSPPATITAAEGLAAQLTMAETAIRDPATPSAKLPALGRSQQRAYRVLVRHSQLVPKVLAQLPPRLRLVVQANVVAGSELRKLNGAAGRLPRWRIVAPAPAGRLLAAYRAAEAKLAVPREYLAAIHLVETRLGRIRGTSSAGAQGPMQLLPSTWRRYGRGGDIQATGDAILAAARLLRTNGAPATWPLPCMPTIPAAAMCARSAPTPASSGPTREPSWAITTGRCSMATPSCPRATRPGRPLQLLADRRLAPLVGHDHASATLNATPTPG
jgi:membrane-bound lytic murein transglycosylase B